jgi:hypothetical protein
MNYKCNDLDHSGNPFCYLSVGKVSPEYPLGTKTAYLNSPRRMQIVI